MERQLPQYPRTLLQPAQGSHRLVTRISGHGFIATIAIQSHGHIFSRLLRLALQGIDQTSVQRGPLWIGEAGSGRGACRGSARRGKRNDGPWSNPHPDSTMTRTRRFARRACQAALRPVSKRDRFEGDDARVNRVGDLNQCRNAVKRLLSSTRGGRCIASNAATRGRSICTRGSKGSRRCSTGRRAGREGHVVPPSRIDRSTSMIALWIRPLLATSAGASRASAPPFRFVTRPPASSTRRLPAATSQGPSRSSQ